MVDDRFSYVEDDVLKYGTLLSELSVYSKLFYLNECSESVFVHTDAAWPSVIARNSDTKNTGGFKAKRVIKSEQNVFRTSHNTPHLSHRDIKLLAKLL
jgi:hypothetical protein